MSRPLARSHEPGQMGIIDNPAMAPLQLGMDGRLPTAMNAHNRVADRDPDPLPPISRQGTE